MENRSVLRSGKAANRDFGISLLAVTFACLLGPIAGAQNKAVPVAPSVPQTAAQHPDPAVLAKMKASAVQHGTLQNKVINPALFKRGRMPEIIASLEKQKAAVAVERTAILRAAGRLPSAVNVPAVQDTRNLNSTIANTNGATQSSVGNAKSRPPGTASSGSNSKKNMTSVPPVSGAALAGSNNAAKETSLPASKYGQYAVCHGPTINTVNGQTSGATFSSDPQYNQYTITGCGFGAQQGQARLFGPFVARTLNLTIEFWSDTAIIAALDPNLSGEPDQQGTVNLVIAPVGAPQVEASGFNFYAVREMIPLPSFPLNWAHLQQVKDTQGWGSVVGTTYYSPANASPGRLVYQAGNPVGDCPNNLFVTAGGPGGWTLDVDRAECGRIGTGTDTFDLTNLPAGLDPYAFQIRTQDFSQADCNQAPGNDTLYFDGSWSELWTGNANIIQITTQSTTCHASGDVAWGGGGTFGLSSYSLQIWVLRPRGVPLPAF